MSSPPPTQPRTQTAADERPTPTSPPSSARPRRGPTSLPKINTFTAPAHSPRKSRFSGGTGSGQGGSTGGSDTGTGTGGSEGTKAPRLMVPPTPIVCPPTPMPVEGDISSSRMDEAGESDGEEDAVEDVDSPKSVGGEAGLREDAQETASPEGASPDDGASPELLASSPESDRSETPAPAFPHGDAVDTILPLDSPGQIAADAAEDWARAATRGSDGAEDADGEVSQSKRRRMSPCARDRRRRSSATPRAETGAGSASTGTGTSTGFAPKPKTGISGDPMSKSPMMMTQSIADAPELDTVGSPEEVTSPDAEIMSSIGGDPAAHVAEHEPTLVPRRRGQSPANTIKLPSPPLPERSETLASTASSLSSNVFSSSPGSSTSGSDPPALGPQGHGLRKAETLAVDGMGAEGGGLAAHEDPSHYYHKRREQSLSTASSASTGSQATSHAHRHGHLHRRSSSSHRVTETLDGKQRQTAEGQRMVNQYALGPTIGKGSYATVERGIDVGTGIEYAIKEFSKSRLKRQHNLDKARSKRLSRVKSMAQQTGPSSGPWQTRDSGAHGSPRGSESGAEACPKHDDEKDKQEEKAEDPLRLIRREVAVMKKLDHPNIVLLYEAIDVPTSDSLFLVLEYLSGGVLMKVSIGQTEDQGLGPAETRDYFRQLLLGLEYLHENDIAHRDIKPDNILFSADKKVVKLCDFGVSEMFSTGDDRMKKSAGSPAFMSPETAITGQHDVHAKAVDIWALGVTLFCMRRGRLPFESHNPLELYDAIKTHPAPIPHEWNPDLKDLLKRMLTKDPDARITLAQIKEHSWVTEHGEFPMPSTEYNLNEIGSLVVEPSEEEINKAISNMRGVFNVIRAVQKLRRLAAIRRTSSNSMQKSATLKAAEAASGQTSPASTPHDKESSEARADRLKLDLSHMKLSDKKGKPEAVFSPDSTASVQMSSPRSVSTEDTGVSDYFASPRTASHSHRHPQGSQSMPPSRENSVDDIDLEKMQQELDKVVPSVE